MSDEEFSMPVRHLVIGVITLGVVYTVLFFGILPIVFFLDEWGPGNWLAHVEGLDPATVDQSKWTDERSQLSPNGRWLAIRGEDDVEIVDARTMELLAYVDDKTWDLDFVRMAWIDDNTVAIERLYPFNQSKSYILWRWHAGRILHNERAAWWIRLVCGPAMVVGVITKLISRASSSKAPT
jgi:hypothetical protein